jgi:hypothetical protein
MPSKARMAATSQIFPETPIFYQKYLTMRNTAGVRGDKPIAVYPQSISGVSAVNPIVAIYITGDSSKANDILKLLTFKSTFDNLNIFLASRSTLAVCK